MKAFYCYKKEAKIRYRYARRGGLRNECQRVLHSPRSGLSPLRYGLCHPALRAPLTRLRGSDSSCVTYPGGKPPVYRISPLAGFSHSPRFMRGIHIHTGRIRPANSRVPEGHHIVDRGLDPWLSTKKTNLNPASRASGARSAG